jgi:hypothetical protein
MSNEFEKYSDKLLENGYVPLPIKRGLKRPAVLRWSEITVSPATINGWLTHGLGSCGVGLRGGELVAVDIDVTYPEKVDSILRWCRETIGEPMIRMGKAPKLALFYRTAQPFSRRDSNYYADSQHIEIRGLDSQTVAYGTHPDTNQPYQWLTDKTPLNTKLEDLIPINQHHVDDLFEFFDGIAKYAAWPLQAENTGVEAKDGDWMKSKYDISDSDLAEALRHIPSDDYHRWVEIGMALYHQFEGSDEGLDLWDAWSSQSPKYDGYDACEHKWRSFSATGKRSTATVGTILHLAQAAGWQNPGISKPDTNEFPEYDGPATERVPVATSVGLNDLRIGHLLDSPAPPIDWLIEDFMPANKVILMTAPGGTGKSMFTLQLGFSLASGFPLAGHWLDLTQTSVLMLGAEDERDDVHRRIESIYHSYSDDFAYEPEQLDALRQAVNARLYHLPMVGKNAKLTYKDKGECVPTGGVDKVIKLAKAIPDLGLIIIDPVSRFRGGDENSQEDVTRFVEVLERIKMETGAAVLAVHHSNKASMREGGADQQYAARGASALTDGVRFQVNLAQMHPDEAERYHIKQKEVGFYVKLAVAKTNYTAPQAGIWLNRGDGGVLGYCDMDAIRHGTDALMNVENAILTAVTDGSANGRLMTRRMLMALAGKGNEIDVAKNSVSDVVDSLVEQGKLRERKASTKGGGKVLEVVEQEGDEDDFLAV